jgi:DNA-binding PadR family transcriptional regulator
MPLKPFSLHILGALAAKDAHAYDIGRQMQHDLRGSMHISSRQLYRDIARLELEGLLEAVPSTRPVRYRLTAHGRRTLTDERERTLQTYRILQERL